MCARSILRRFPSAALQLSLPNRLFGLEYDATSFSFLFFSFFSLFFFFFWIFDSNLFLISHRNRISSAYSTPVWRRERPFLLASAQRFTTANGEPLSDAQLARISCAVTEQVEKYFVQT